MRTKARLKKWGSSLGIVVPADIVKEEGLRENEEIIVDIRKENPLRETFGILRGWKADAQKIKDEARKGWER